MGSDVPRETVNGVVRSCVAGLGRDRLGGPCLFVTPGAVTRAGGMVVLGPVAPFRRGFCPPVLQGVSGPGVCDSPRGRTERPGAEALISTVNRFHRSGSSGIAEFQRGCSRGLVPGTERPRRPGHELRVDLSAARRIQPLWRLIGHRGGGREQIRRRRGRYRPSQRVYPLAPPPVGLRKR